MVEVIIWPHLGIQPQTGVCESVREFVRCTRMGVFVL